MINLNGHSGCDISLYDNNVVRKISPTLEYNGRLKSQMERQQSFSHYILKSPQVYNWGYTDNGLFYFDMEYIHGVNLNIYFQREKLHKCMEIIDLITSFQTNVEQINVRDQVINKIQHIKLDEDTKEILMSNDWVIDAGYGHGDLTFENVIINKNEIYLIDFLDSFINGKIVDESKLLQDAFCYWSFKDQSSIPKRKLLSVSEKFNSKQHYYMLLLHLVRILPYSNTNKKEEILCMIKNVKSQINQF
jgi:tRNA A-37 threonylcarbamoyl transferase component Bud32